MSYFKIPSIKVLRIAKDTIKRNWFKLNNKQIVHFLHIGKTGGNAFKYAINGNCKTKNYFIILHKHKFKLRDVRKGEKVVFTVRDPIERFVSGFYSRKRQGKPRYNIPWSEGEEKAFSQFETPNDLALALTNDNELIRKRAISAMQNIRHVNSFYSDWFENEKYFSERINDILFICNQKKLNEDFEKLKNILGLQCYLELPENEVKAHINPKHCKIELDSIAVKNLTSWYLRDYEFLNYLKERSFI